MTPNISVVIPAYNCEEFIIDALDSVYGQTGIDTIKEVIVVDDGSTDNTRYVVEDYEKKLPIGCPKLVLINKENGGVSSARNTGAKYATGTWLAFLDSDDEWFDSKIERQCEIIENIGEENIDCLGGSFLGDTLSILTKKYEGLFRANIKQICLKNFPQPSTAIVKTSIFHAIGGFDENCRYAEDGKFFMEVCTKYSLYYDTKQVLVFGHGKRGFGVSGLSGNLKAMHLGNIRNIKDLRNAKEIGWPFYAFLRVFYQIKYIRRKMLSR